MWFLYLFNLPPHVAKQLTLLGVGGLWGVCLKDLWSYAVSCCLIIFVVFWNIKVPTVKKFLHSEKSHQKYNIFKIKVNKTENLTLYSFKDKMLRYKSTLKFTRFFFLIIYLLYIRLSVIFFFFYYFLNFFSSSLLTLKEDIPFHIEKKRTLSKKKKKKPARIYIFVHREPAVK